MAETATGRYRAPAQTDVVVLGAGHNGLVTAAYLARFGLRVTVLERLDRVGGAAVSDQLFPGIEARLSCYSYLVSLIPYAVVRDLELDLELRSRPVASYTPVRREDGRADGLLVERRPGPATIDSFRRITGSDRDWQAWRRFYEQIGKAGRVIAPTLLEPLPGRGVLMKAVREACGSSFWGEFMERPIGEIVESTFEHDEVRGIVLTDALIGTQSWAHDPSLRQNRCFLYHVMASQSGEWRVPIGGMGAVTGSLERAAVKAGARIQTGATVTRVETDGRIASVTYRTAEGEQQIEARYVAANLAPQILTELLGQPAPEWPEGNQLKVNLVLSRLPALKSGLAPELAFAGTFHVDESAQTLARAYQESEAGRLPDPLPFEAYCHTLTDRTILSPDAVRAGLHTITLFGLHTPGRLFRQEGAKEQAVQLALAGLNRHLAEPIEECLALDADGEPCIEALSPLDVEAQLAMPGGHIFHGDLDWPWAGGHHPAGSWGVETQFPNIVLCGSGAVRGGAVSGIPGRAAALCLAGRIQRSQGRPRGR